MKNFWATTALLISRLVILTGCANSRMAGGSSSQNREEYAGRRQVDSVRVYVRDSIVVRISGDTIYRDRWHTRYRDRWRDRSDTLVVRDSIRQEIPVMVDRPLSGWQHFQIWSGRIALALLLGGVLLIVLKRF